MAIMQALMGSYSSGGSGSSGVTSFSWVDDSYSRTTTEGNTSHSVSVPTGAQSGDVLILSVFMDRSSAQASTPSGWTFLGHNNIEAPGSSHFYRIYDGTGSPWSTTWSTDKTYWGSMVAFRPDATITTLSAEQFTTAGGDTTTITNTISSVATTNAPGGRIYFHTSSSTGASDLDTVTDTFGGSSGWTTVSGQGVITGDANNYNYKLDTAGTAFTSTTVSSQSGNKFQSNFFILNAE